MAYKRDTALTYSKNKLYSFCYEKLEAEIAAVRVASFFHYANGKIIFHFHVKVKRHFFVQDQTSLVYCEIFKTRRS